MAAFMRLHTRGLGRREEGRGGAGVHDMAMVIPDHLGQKFAD